MYRLQGSDANFLYQETPTAPMHTIKIYIIDPPEGGSIDWDDIIQRTELLLPQLPVLRQRPVFVPFGLHHPVMIEDPDFDLDYHVCRAALPAPGGMRELDAMVAQIGSHSLDLQRPLWEMWYVEGLEGGRGACIHKIHHALADGMATVGYINKVWDSMSQPGDTPQTPRQVEQIPSARRLIWDALVDHVKYDVRHFPALVRALWQGVRNVRAYSREKSAPTFDRFRDGLPKTRWNCALSAKRSFATAQLAFDDVQKLRKTLGGTVNDMVMALVAGSVRQFLLEEGELPERPLLVSVPVAVDGPGAVRVSGNRIASLSTLLHLNLEDPIERLNAIRESTAEGKGELEAVGRETYGMLLQYIPPAFLQWVNRRGHRLRKADRPDYLPFSNLSVSNVPGPREELRDNLHVVSDFYSIGPLLEGVGLNVTVWSYAGKLNFSILGCKQSLPDVHRIGEGIRAAYDELAAAVEALPPAAEADVTAT